MGIFLFTTASKPALGPTQPPIQWVPGALSLGIKRPGRYANHSPPSSAEIKECVELRFHSPNTPSWRGAQLKHRDNFTFTFDMDESFPCRLICIIDAFCTSTLKWLAPCYGSFTPVEQPPSIQAERKNSCHRRTSNSGLSVRSQSPYRIIPGWFSLTTDNNNQVTSPPLLHHEKVRKQDVYSVCPLCPYCTSTKSACATRFTGKLSLCFNWTPRHEGVLGSGGVAPLIRWPRP
jgi:hypothetical protein